MPFDEIPSGYFIGKYIYFLTLGQGTSTVPIVSAHFRSILVSGRWVVSSDGQLAKHWVALSFVESLRHKVWDLINIQNVSHRVSDLSCHLKAKFHYTDTDTNPTRTRPDPHGPNGVSPQKSPCGSVRVRWGPCRVRVVEFSYYWSLKFSDGKWTASRPGRATRLPCVCVCSLHRDINSAANRPLLCSLGICPPAGTCEFWQQIITDASSVLCSRCLYM